MLVLKQSNVWLVDSGKYLPICSRLSSRGPGECVAMPLLGGFFTTSFSTVSMCEAPGVKCAHLLVCTSAWQMQLASRASPVPAFTALSKHVYQEQSTV